LRFGVRNRGAGATLMVMIGGGENCGRHDGLGLGPAGRRHRAYALVRVEVVWKACNSILHRSKKQPTFLGKLHP
jgi:hypothetical protein